MNSVTY